MTMLVQNLLIHLLKKEEIYRNTYRNFEEANIAIFKYSEAGATESGNTLLLIT